MHTISGLHPPCSGSITFEGAALSSLPPHRVVERGVVLVPEGRHIFASMRVLENLEIGAFSSRARKEAHTTLKWIFEVFPILAERRNQIAGTLSGGQQQMLAIGRALMGLPRLLLLDEPSLGLAPLVIRDIFEILKRVNASGLTVLLVEQNARMALQLANRAYILEQGRVVGEGTGAELLSDVGVQRAYLGYVGAA
jgi:branched-chain amino acid transport system ATP-binding protein